MKEVVFNSGFAKFSKGKKYTIGEYLFGRLARRGIVRLHVEKKSKKKQDEPTG